VFVVVGFFWFLFLSAASGWFLNFHGWEKMLACCNMLLYSTGRIDLYVPVGYPFLSNAVPCGEKLARILEILFVTRAVGSVA